MSAFQADVGIIEVVIAHHCAVDERGDIRRRGLRRAQNGGRSGGMFPGEGPGVSGGHRGEGPEPAAETVDETLLDGVHRVLAEIAVAQ
jgi:hypothetical protein